MIATAVAVIVIVSSLTAVLVFRTQVSPGGNSSVRTSSLSSSPSSTLRTAATSSSGAPCSAPSPSPVLPNPTNQGYSWSVNYTGPWNATAVGITGNGTTALTQCYRGTGPGYVYTPDWSASGGTTLSVAAHKMDANNETLVLAFNGRIESTSAQYGSVAITDYISVTPESTIHSNATEGLQLTATINPINVPQGSNVSVTAQVYNTLSRDVEVNATSMTNPADGPCQQGLATGVKVYQGGYSAANLSKAAELLLYNPSLIYTCPEVFTFQYSFAPNSDVATVQASLSGNQVGKNTTGPVDETSVLSGYWTGSGQNYTFDSFPQGNYTLVVFDAWGQEAIGHFQVTPQGGTTSSTCPSTSPSAGFLTVTAGTGSPALLCVQLYYYSATPLTLNLTGALSIQALQYVYNGSVGNPRSFSGASNFTVSASQSQLTIGGPNNENEGTIVAYAVTAKAGASGTYQLGYLPSSSLNTWMLGSQEPEQCGYYGQLIAGNGQPSYVQPTGCITYTSTHQSNSTTTISSSSPTVPGIPYQLISGDIYFRIVGATNSTG